MNLFQRYLASEFAEDYEEGRLSRREALKLIASVTGSLLAANSILASCAPPESTATGEPAPTDSPPTEQPSASPTDAPTAESAATEAPAPGAYGTVMPEDPAVIANEVQIPASDTNILGYLARPAAEGAAANRRQRQFRRADDQRDREGRPHGRKRADWRRQNLRLADGRLRPHPHGGTRAGGDLGRCG